MGVIDVIKKQERQEGLQQGAEQERREIINNLLKQTDFDDAMIASLTGATESLVKKIRTELNEKNKG
ncbi:hypothetical protein [Albibacterium profundi]|uniref:Uncharacterized protein n=1 Tax=Albibacterium profundi TaxID=3134906 RepID=A0ABV5CAW0_9SPHI